MSKQKKQHTKKVNIIGKKKQKQKKNTCTSHIHYPKITLHATAPSTIHRVPFKGPEKNNKKKNAKPEQTSLTVLCGNTQKIPGADPFFIYLKKKKLAPPKADSFPPPPLHTFQKQKKNFNTLLPTLQPFPAFTNSAGPSYYLLSGRYDERNPRAKNVKSDFDLQSSPAHDETSCL